MFNFLRKKPKNVEFFYNTDVHCHILPGVDHGAKDVEQSLMMLEAQKAMGINRVICTSHVTASTFENTPETLTAAYEILKKAVEDARLDMEIHASAEYRIDEYWESQYAAGALLPMPGNYLLMENSFQQELLQLDDLMFELMCKGYKPVMAHPERFLYYGHRHDRLTKLHSVGVKFQVNILSFSDYFGSTARNTALWLVKNKMVDMLGSDMHNMEHVRLIQDFLKTKEWRRISKQIEPHLMNDMVK